MTQVENVKVTRIGRRWHVRLFINGRLASPSTRRREHMPGMLRARRCRNEACTGVVVTTKSKLAVIYEGPRDSLGRVMQTRLWLEHDGARAPGLLPGHAPRHQFHLETRS